MRALLVILVKISATQAMDSCVGQVAVMVCAVPVARSTDDLLSRCRLAGPSAPAWLDAVSTARSAALSWRIRRLLFTAIYSVVVLDRRWRTSFTGGRSAPGRASIVTACSTRATVTLYTWFAVLRASSVYVNDPDTPSLQVDISSKMVVFSIAAGGPVKVLRAKSVVAGAPASPRYRLTTA